MIRLVLSLFPGIDLLGRGFEQEGFCIVRGPDPIFGGDIRDFHAPRGLFDGIIAGSPCQDFSCARRAPPAGHGAAMLAEFARVVTEAAPDWFLLENVPNVPDLHIAGYGWQRIDIDARDVGLTQRRLRHFQFGRRDGAAIAVHRSDTLRSAPGASTCMASEASRPHRRDWGEFCALQGLPRDFELPGMTKAARYRAVGNGVAIPVARLLARAIAANVVCAVCACGCARPVTGKQRMANAACRKRLQRRRDRPGGVTRRPVTSASVSHH